MGVKSYLWLDGPKEEVGGGKGLRTDDISDLVSGRGGCMRASAIFVIAC